MIAANHQQPREFSLRARVRLQRDGGESGDLRERCLEIAE